LAQLGNLPLAIGQWEQALRIMPDNAATHDSLGLALADQGRHAEAMEHFRKALELVNAQGDSTQAAEIQNQIRFYETNVPPLPKP
jgi:Flp pilus assembly protein TadD